MTNSAGAARRALALRGVAFLARGEEETDRAPQSAHRQVDLGAQAAPRASDSLILSPPFAPLACWGARIIVESMIRYSKSADPKTPRHEKGDRSPGASASRDPA